MLLSITDRRCYALQIDDAEDAQIVSVLLDQPVPDGFDVCNTERMPGVPNLISNLQVSQTMCLIYRLARPCV